MTFKAQDRQLVRMLPDGLLRQRRDLLLQKAAGAEGVGRADLLARAFGFEAELLRRAESELRRLRREAAGDGE